ncbi:hypothetical protein [Vibrio sp. TBV020]|uniref:hypothetical protein n=1 Tax=Vibrio sp. TBV020 TaxID=3137398 RepID=UPI0038CD39B6
MPLPKNTIEARLIPNNMLHHMCMKLLNDQGFNESEARKIIEVEVYLLSPRDTRKIRNQVNRHEHTFEQATLLLLKQKQRHYFLILLQQFLDAQARKYTENSKPSLFLNKNIKS